MTDQTGATPVDASATDAPPAAAPAAPAMGAQDEPIGEGGKAAIAQERERARAAEARAKAAETELQKHRDAQLSDIEKANKRAEAAEKARLDAETALHERTVQSAVVSAAAAANFIHPDIAARLIASGSVELDADGSPKNVDRLVSDLAKAMPELVRGAGSFDLGARSNGAAGLPVFRASQINDRTFWEKNKDAIMAAQRDGRIVLDN